MASAQENAVVVKDLYKTFKLPHEQHSGIKQKIINILKGIRGYETLKVLRGVSFKVKKGEFFGIVGSNGSGKSTLLKLLAGTYVPDKGLVQVNGSLTPFIELGVGFNQELTGRENIFLNGALLGFSRSEMESMYDSIVEFAELEKFMDQKLKNYSSGMQVRLAFSIAIRADSDILLIDEVLAVGDAAFQQKCYSYFDKLKSSDKTIILITHDMNAVRQFCDRALMIEDGKVKIIGKSVDASLEYERSNFSLSEPKVEEDNLKTKNHINIYNKNHKLSNKFEYGQEFILSIKWAKEYLVGGVGFIISKNGEEVFATNTFNRNVDLSKRSVQLKLRPALADGRYKIKAGLFGLDRRKVVDFIEGPEIVIYNQPVIDGNKSEWHGIVHIENEWL